jgi:phage baseplate assembly protein V
MRSHEPVRDLDRKFYGVVEGIVVDNIDPDKQGRIKVKFPWYDEGTVTEWCRVRQLYAGRGYGTFFVPEKDDEVLLAFIHGDMRMAIVLGGLYNGKDRPPSDRQKDDEKDEKVIRTKGGHQLMFDDTRDKEKIELVSKSGQTLLLDDAAKQITIRTSGGQTLVMDAVSGSITLSGVTLTLTGSASIGLESPAIGFTGASVTLGSAPTDRVVLGDQLMALFNAHTHPIPTGSTGTPSPPMTASQLSQAVKVG